MLGPKKKLSEWCSWLSKAWARLLFRVHDGLCDCETFERTRRRRPTVPPHLAYSSSLIILPKLVPSHSQIRCSFLPHFFAPRHRRPYRRRRDFRQSLVSSRRLHPDLDWLLLLLVLHPQRTRSILINISWPHRILVPKEFLFGSTRTILLSRRQPKDNYWILQLTANRLSEMVMSLDNVRGFALATSSSAFIGSSFVIKKIGLKKAGDAGVRAGSGGYSYLYEPLWWIGMITMILGEVANFAAYAFAPAILVTPLGALSIIFSAVLAHFILNERLHMFGVVGCILCVVGSVGIVLHAPKERRINSVSEIWHLATEPGFIVYSCLAVALALVLIFWVVHWTEQRKMLAYIAICSLMGSLTVISVKAVAIALKLSFSGVNQFIYIQTWFFTIVVIICCLVQLNYLNKALDSFNTAVVSPVYYVMFTILTILANMIMYKDWDSQNATQIATELCGFVTIVAGTFLLHKTRDMGNTQPDPASRRGECELQDH